MKNVKMAARHYTLEFFKTKGNEIERTYNQEISTLFTSYDSLRKKYFLRERKMAVITKVLKKQEDVIFELSTNSRENFKEIYETLEKHEPRIEKAIDAILPTDKRYSKYDEDNPFSLYCGYLDLVRPVDNIVAIEEWKGKCQLLEEELRQKNQEIYLSNNYQAIFMA